MVALDDKGKSKKGLPALQADNVELAAIAQKRKEMSLKWTADQQWVNEAPLITTEMIASVGESSSAEPNSSKETHVRMDDTVVEVQSAFLQRHENPNHTIFGGDILIWMDKVAVYCARNFTRNHNMVTISMNRIFFKRPIFQSQVVHMRARICYVRHSTVEVEIEVTTKCDSEQKEEKSHTGYFTVLNLGEGDIRRRVLNGILLSQDDQCGMKSFFKAKKRHVFNDDNKDIFVLPPIPVGNSIKSSL